MKLGASYNVFDGEELLEGSIMQIRNSVDYISVIYQTKSNINNDCSPELLPLLSRLKNSGLVDALHEYRPNLAKAAHWNETKKRNLGLDLSKKVGCTHHISLDTDEYYISRQFDMLKNMIDDGGYDSSYCQMQTYYKSWKYCLDPPEEYYVSLIYKIKFLTSYKFGIHAPVLVDPTRRMSRMKNPLILPRTTIEMHHGSYIRNDIQKKLANSSSRINFEQDIVTHYINWQYPDRVLWGGLPSKYLHVREVDPTWLLCKSPIV